MSLPQRGIQAVKWSFISEITSKAIGPLVFLVLARLLVPEDFGVVAAATVIISFSQVFSEAGLPKALIQRKDRTDESANVVFWINLGLGLIVVAALILLAPLIAQFFHDERITAVVRVLSAQILLAAFSSVHTALLQKALSFKRLFWVRLVTTGLPGLISIPLAINGMGYWALVAGTLMGQIAQSLMLWRQSDWRPSWGLSRGLVAELVAFGKWAMLSGLLGWFFLWMDAIVVGHYLDSHELGLYHVGNTFVAIVMSLIVGPIVPVLYSVLSRQQDDIDAVQKNILTIAKLVALVIAPLGAGMFLTRDSLSELVFGQSWVGVANVIGLLAVTQFTAYSVTIMQEGYRSIGRPRIETTIMFISVLIRIPFYLLSVQYGLIAFVLARLASTVVGVMNHLIFASKILRITVRDYLGTIKVAVFSSVIMLGVAEFVLLPLVQREHAFAQLLIVVPLCVVLYSCTLWVTDRAFLKAIYGMFRDRPLGQSE